MTAKKATKKKDPNLCTFVGGHSDGVESVVGPDRMTRAIGFVGLGDDCPVREIEYVDIGESHSVWRQSVACDYRGWELYVRSTPPSNEFLCWKKYKDDPRLAWYRIANLEMLHREVLEKIAFVTRTKKTRWFHRK